MSLLAFKIPSYLICAICRRSQPLKWIRSLPPKRNFITSVACKSEIYYDKHESFSVDLSKDESPIVSNSNVYNEADPGPVFIKHEVQQILKSISGSDPHKIFRHRKIVSKLSTPRHVFMTDKQLEEAHAEAQEKQKKILNMPPVLKVRKEEPYELCRDPALQGLNKFPLVFTDVSQEVADRDRLVWVRETDGVLRMSTPDEKHRMNCIFNPREGRNMKMPEIFHERSFKEVLEQKRYEYLLDRVCVQLEPDDQQFQEIAACVYDAVERAGDFSLLHSTRHFGPMVFYLTWFGKADTLIESCLKEYKPEEAAEVVRLYALVHPGSATAAAIRDDPSISDDPIQLVTTYMRTDCVKRPNLEIGLKLYKEYVESLENFERIKSE